MRLYGLIGYPLSHSFSAGFFKQKFEEEVISDCTYRLFPLEAITQLPFVLAEPGLCGLNVTIPYKEQVLPYLHKLSPAVQAIGACNCISIDHGKLTGHNTDVIGFEQSLLPLLKPHHRSALVLGTGGAAKAVAYVLQQNGIAYRYVSSSGKEGSIAYAGLNESIMRSHPLIINTTPLGMYPKIDEKPEIPYTFIDSTHLLFDLIYNPAETAFLKEGRERGAFTKNGLEMLVIQAEESWKIWNS